MELKQKALSGIRWTTTSAVVGVIIQVIQLAIVARFLKPFEFGLMAVVNVVIGFSQVFMDMGISNAIIHHQKISHEQLSSLYWLNIMSGGAVFVIICLITPFVTLFYKEPQLQFLIILVGANFLIIPWGQQFQILLQKELKFNSIARIEILSKFISFASIVIFLLMGARVYSLALGGLISCFISTLLFVWAGMKMHKPSFIFYGQHLKGFLSFGVYQIFERTLNYFNLQFDSLLIGRLLGMSALGTYTLPKDLVLKPIFIINPIVTKVTFPMMAKIQDDTEFLKRTYLKTINYLASVCFPLYIFLAVFADVVVDVIFGDKWHDSIFTLRVLALWALFRSTGNPIGSLVLAKGRAGLSFAWNFVLFLFIPLAIYFGSHWDVEGVSIALLILQIGLIIPSWFFLVNKLCDAGLVEYLKQIFIPLSISLVAALTCLPFVILVPNVLIKITLIVLIGAPTYVILTIRFNGGFSGAIRELGKANAA